MEEKGLFSGQPNSDAYLVKWGFAGEFQMYKAADLETALQLIIKDGWQLMGPIPANGKPWEVLVRRTKE